MNDQTLKGLIQFLIGIYWKTVFEILAQKMLVQKIIL